jgi:UDP-GlcNAc:undecaprenyl-phosphate GlcNAc-1-phosphate transferase
MRSYLTLFTTSLLLSLILTPLVGRKAIAWGAIDLPNDGRRIHLRPTPRLGGVAIYFSFLLTLSSVPLFSNLVSESFRAYLPQLISLMLPATFIFAFGIYDDFRGSTAPVKIVIQTIAAAMIYALGFRIDSLSSPFGGSWELPGVLSFALTALWVVVITNAFNLIDGVDGLAAGASVFALFSIFFFSFAQGHPEISLIAVVLTGAVMGFLRYNFNPATIFLGDSGSLFLGFMAASLSLASSQKGSTIVAIAIPLVSFGLPVVEAGLSLVRRFLGGDSLLAGDRGHIHHMLLRRGLTQRQVVILLYGICAVFTLFGLMLLNPQRNLAALIFFVLGVGIILGVQRLRYAEFSELGSQLRRRVAFGRRSLAVNVRVRRTSDDLSGARNPQQLFAALSVLLATDEFDCVVLEVNRAAEGFDEAAARYLRFSQPGGEMRVVWAWERSGTPPIETIETIVTGRYWMLRLPLDDGEGEQLGAVTFYRHIHDSEPMIDLQNLCGPLRRELSAALSRLLALSAKAG